MAIDKIQWHEFLQRFRWNQGEHVTIIAPTGWGKTTLELGIIDKRKYSIFFATKRDDPLYHKLIRKHGFERVERFRDVMPWQDKILLWPHHRPVIRQTTKYQAQVFREALDKAVAQMRWTLWFDEAKYMVGQLGMEPEITFANEQLRATGGTVINVGQRPRFMGVSSRTNASHVFLTKTNDAADTKTLSDIGGVNARELAKESLTLDRHECIYVATRGNNATLYRTQVKV